MRLSELAGSAASTMVKSYMTSGEEDILQAKDVVGDIGYTLLIIREVYPTRERR
ncbi:hypothetical protein V6Z54_00005 [Bacillus sp. MAG717A]|uniref:hypothetical protein n=1 Tax=Bacillus sp. MAG717A TaxID=3122078 RepID=UPI0030CF66C7